MGTLTYRITTLGCRVNHAEARELESILVSRGLCRAAASRRADLEVVHTCSVTITAAAKSRHAIRRAAHRQRNGGVPHSPSPDATPPTAHVLVTGCYASTNPQDATRLAGLPHGALQQAADDGSTMIGRFTERVERWLSNRPAPQSIRETGPLSSPGGRPGVRPLPLVPPQPGATPHIRAELKIQDGCDAHCTFCIIPRIRRTLRSKTVRDAVAEAKRLVDLGHREIVLTGIFLGAFGHETALRRRQAERHAHPLADLLDAVAQVPGLQRLRLSSVEPGDVTEPLLDAMVANAPAVVPHLHLPLQSGSDSILKMMNRQYRRGDYLEMVDQVNEALTTSGLPPALTTDIICGFPGESETDFERTIEVVERVGYPRPGTAAARWTDRFVPERVTKARVRRLIDMEHDPRHGLSIRYRRRLPGRTVRVILEQPDRDDPASMTGRCDHYAMISIPTSHPRGSVINAEVTEATPTRTIGRLTGTSLPLPMLS
ncbi:MAG: MiaB/RimO family radical SAM methylthiotransferase [Planctomycetota bacterium]|jgi:threonylcarbamoyladenosine tRNA methylthiotransferase MtaB